MTEQPQPLTSLRADKWLHHLRVFKTRSIASEACQKSNVKLGGQTIKPSREVRVGDTLEIERGELKLILKVTGLPPYRLSAPLVADFCEDLTPAENYQKAAAARLEKKLTSPTPHEAQLKPNKRDLRLIRQWMGRGE